MRKGSRESLFWTSYSDLMTSLFFVMLVLFVVTTVAMGRSLSKAINEKNVRDSLNVLTNKTDSLIRAADSLRLATNKQIEKIKSIENSIQNIDSRWFLYNDTFKKHVLKIDVSFKTGSSNMEDITLQAKEDLYQAGLAIDKFLTNAIERYGESVNYLLIIEGQASNDNYDRNFELSYERALSFYRYLQYDRNVELKKKNCEVLICGSGTQGVMRSYPDVAGNIENQRFLIHILPKPGIIE